MAFAVHSIFSSHPGSIEMRCRIGGGCALWGERSLQILEPCGRLPNMDIYLPCDGCFFRPAGSRWYPRMHMMPPPTSSNVRVHESGARRVTASMLEELRQTRLITNEQKFFASLTPPADDVFHRLGIDREEIDTAIKKFEYATITGLSITIDHHYFSTSQLTQPNVVVYGRCVTMDGVLVAIWASTVFLDASKQRGSEIVVVEKDMRRSDMAGFGRAFIAFYNHLNRRFNLDYEFIRAAWLGRKVWTQLGAYQFDPRYTFLVDGTAMTQADAVAANFRRFLAHHGISAKTLLYLPASGHALPFAQAVAQGCMGTPSDYLRIVSAHGMQVTIAPLLDYQAIESPVAYPIGEAFVLSDSRPYEGQMVQVHLVKDGIPLADGEAWPPNNSFSDRAMPPWIGIRYFSTPVSP